MGGGNCGDAEEAHGEADGESGDVEEPDQECGQVEGPGGLAHGGGGVRADPAFLEDAEAFDSGPGLVAVEAGRDLFEAVNAQECCDGGEEEEREELPAVAEGPIFEKLPGPVPVGVGGEPDEALAGCDFAGVGKALSEAVDEVGRASVRGGRFVERCAAGVTVVIAAGVLCTALGADDVCGAAAAAAESGVDAVSVFAGQAEPWY